MFKTNCKCPRCGGILYTHFDVIFLCRSDNFFAPHLDPYFDEIVRLIESRFHDIRIEKSVNKVRDYRKYDSIYEKLKRKEAVSI